MTNVRQTIATRLKQEMQRKGISLHQFSNGAGLPSTIVESYLAGTREIDFAELKKICGVLVLDVMWLIGKNYQKSHLQYRQSGPRDREIASKIENAFLIVKDCLPNVKRLSAPKIDTTQSDIQWLLAHINKSVESVRNQYSTVEEILSASNIPILTVRAGSDAFDAFFMTSGQKAVICVNLDKHTVRIHFSLLHEVAHFLYDFDREVPVDLFVGGLYYENISVESMPEYIANKFAQFFLVPFTDAEKFAKDWQHIKGIENYIDNRRTGTDVLVNAIYDVLRMYGNAPSYSSVKSVVTSAVTEQWGGDSALRSFLRESGNSLRNRLEATRDEYSDEVWGCISDAWELNNGPIF